MDQEPMAPSPGTDSPPQGIRLRLRRLQIDKYRNVAPGTVLVFNDGMNVLLGPNGSGKTTLLRLIAAIVREDFQPMAEEELDISYDVRLFHQLFRVRLVNRRTGGGPGRRATMPHGGELDWWFLVSLLGADGVEQNIFEGNPLGAKDHSTHTPRPVRDPLREGGPIEQVVDLFQDWTDHASRQPGALEEPDLMRDLVAAVDFVVGALGVRLSLLSEGGRFDEALGVFATIVGSPAVLEMPDRQFVHLSIQGDYIGGSFLPRELRRAVEALPMSARDANITLSNDALPFLKRAVELFGGKKAEMILRLKERDEEGRVTFDDFEFHFTLDDGTMIRHDLLSWGQKRILSFFYYAAANPDVLVVDELVNGLHHEWIDACLSEMEGRQCFLTSQNPLLLDHLAFSSPEDVRQTFIQCRRERGERRAELRWGPMDEASAESFFRAYKVGIQHVGEILRTKGLW